MHEDGFWYTNGADWYITRGDTNDWAYGAWSALDTTIELNTQKTPSPSQIPTYCAQHRQAVLNYMMKVFQGIHGVMTDQSRASRSTERLPRRLRRHRGFRFRGPIKRSSPIP
jgi:hypothetical protein